MANELRLAQWQYAIDPTVTHVFALDLPPGKDMNPAAGPFINDDGHPARLIVLRQGTHPPKFVKYEDAPQFELWELPSQSLQALESRSLQAPSSFEGKHRTEIHKPEAQPITTRLETLHLQNFRCFEKRTFTFSQQFNVLIGSNGSGKSAILDAIAQTLRRVVGWLDPSQKDTADRISIQQDVRRILTKDYENPSAIPCFPAKIDPRFFFYNEPDAECGWEARQSESALWEGTGQAISFANIIDFVRILHHDAHRSIALPLFAYYPSHRRWERKNGLELLSEDDIRRSAGYKNWDNPSLNLRAAEHWLTRAALIESQRQMPNKTYRALKECILSSLRDEGIEDVRFDGDLNELAVQKQDGPWLPFRSLSDGVKNVTGLFADLATRCARLNPHLGANAAKETGGIVLIDELDLHLHPTWQCRIVENLREAFPKLQFIVTTHSPFIVQSLRPHELIDLDGRGGEYYRQSIEEIAQFVMGAEDTRRDRRWLKMKEAAKKYFRILREPGADPKDIEERKAQLDILIAPYTDDPAYAAFLEMKREAAGLGGKPE